MADLAVFDLIGNVEMLTNASVARKISETNEKYINIEAVEDDTNIQAFKLLKNECYVIYKNEEYIVKKINFRTFGQNRKGLITAYHRFYEDFNINRRYDTINGTFRINAFAEFIFRDSGYAYEINHDGIEGSVTVENFGDDSLLRLLNTMVSRFDVEFKIEGKKVLIAKEHARYLDEQMRYEFNINDPKLDLDSTDLRTYIRGYGKQDEETGEYLAQQEYTSPLAEIYGIKHASPVRDERFTNNQTLLAEMKSRLTDYIPMSLTLTAVDLIEMGIKDVKKGDYVWCIIEPFDLDVRLRVVEVEDYSDEDLSPKFTFGTLKVGASQIIKDWKEAKSTLDRIVADGGIHYSAIPSAIRESSQAINAVSNAVDFTSRGITTNELVKRSAVPDLLFGSGKIQASGQTVINWRGVNLATAYGDLPPHVIDEIIANVEIPENPTYGLATENEDGLMGALDKRKLDQIITNPGETYDLSDIIKRITELEGRGDQNA